MLGAAPGEPRPPYVRFETRPVEERRADGTLGYVDKDFALVTPLGSRDVVEKLIPEWFDKLRWDVQQGRFPQAWLDGLRGGYKDWKETQVQPTNGTPISNWPAATPAEKKTLAAAGVRSIEDLAQAPEELISRIGMGARSLKDRAKDWVTAATNHAPLIAQLDGMRKQVETQQEVIAGLQAVVKDLKRELESRPAGQPFIRELSTPVRQDDDDKLIDKTIEEELNG